jgi:hypothetical protein
MAKRIEYTSGQIVGELKFVRELDYHIQTNKKTGKKLKVRQAEFQCACGKPITALIGSVVSKQIVRCMKCRSSHLSLVNTKHGHAKKNLETKAHRTWRSMLQRCQNPNTDRYPNYGGRGIFVCDPWRSSFENFLLWWNLQDLCQAANASIDRIDNDKEYSPSNCRLIPIQLQAKNKSTNVWLTDGRDTLCQADLAKRLGVNHSTISGYFKDHGKFAVYKGWRFV